MVRQSLFLNIFYLLLASILMILIVPYANTLLHYMLNFYYAMDRFFGTIFSHGPVGSIIQQVLAIIIAPVLLALIPMAIYWFARRRTMPFAYLLIWVLWVILVTAVVLKA